MMWILIVTVFISPIGYVTTGIPDLTYEQCQDAAWLAKGEARCVNP